MFTEKNSIFKWCSFFGILAMNTLFWACSDNDVAGGASGDAGVYAIKDLDGVFRRRDRLSRVLR